MEGFCRLLHHGDAYEREVLLYSSHHLSKCILDAFYAFITSANVTEEEVDIVILEEVPADVYVSFVL